MRKLSILTLTFLLTCGVAGLFGQSPKETGQTQTSPPVAEAKPPAKTSNAPAATTFVIGPEDVLDISVWREPNVSRSVPVRMDGKISIPLLNDVQAAGLTPMQLAAVITEKLKKFLSNPQVTVTVTAINSQMVFMVGELNHPGPIRLLPDMTALEAISSAGGITQFADQKHAYILRHENGKDVRFPLNYRSLLRGSSRGNIILKAGDTIVVP